MNPNSKHIDAQTKAAVTTMACSVLLFAVAFLSINANAVVLVEQKILAAMAESSHPWLDLFFNGVTLLGDFTILCPVVVLCAASLCYKRCFRTAGLLCVSFFGAALSTSLLKNVFDRPRPELFDSALPYLPTNAAFPSGHTTHAMAIALFLGWLAFRHQRYWLLFTAGIVATLVAISRLYLQVHWPTDLLGSVAVSTFWVGAAVLVNSYVSFSERGKLSR